MYIYFGVDRIVRNSILKPKELKMPYLYTFNILSKTTGQRQVRKEEGFNIFSWHLDL